jgi:hypothetical protein
VSRVVCVHGVGQQLKGEDVLAGEWLPALRDGMRRAGANEAVLPRPRDVGFAFYGDLFRPPGRSLAVGDAWLTSEDLDGFERDMLGAWWAGAAEADPGVISPGAASLAGVPGGVQRALRALSGSVFFAGVAERALLHDLRQVRLYLTEPGIREAVQQRVAATVDSGTRVLVGHSLPDLRPIAAGPGAIRRSSSGPVARAGKCVGERGRCWGRGGTGEGPAPTVRPAGEMLHGE